MKANPHKCHLLLINESCKMEIKTAGNIIEKSTSFKKPILLNSFFESQFSYCSPAWMCHSHRSNNSKSAL